MEQDEKETKRHYAELVEVTKVQIEQPKNNKTHVARLVFVTPDRNITCKVSKQVEEKSDIAGIETISPKSELYTITELLTTYPIIKELNDRCKEKPQSVTMTYEHMHVKKANGEKNDYYYMRDFMFMQLYFEPVHGDDVSRIEKQREWEENAKKNAVDL